MQSFVESASSMNDLQRAFSRLTADVPGLQVEVVGHLLDDITMVHPVAGFEVRLERPQDATATLYVSELYAELAVRPAEGDADAGFRQSFNVRLSDGEFHWGDTAFADAGELTGALLGYMQYQLDATAEVVG